MMNLLSVGLTFFEYLILFTILLLLRPMIRKKLGSSWIEWGWGLLLLRILIPNGIFNPFSLMTLAGSLKIGKPGGAFIDSALEREGSMGSIIDPVIRVSQSPNSIPLRWVIVIISLCIFLITLYLYFSSVLKFKKKIKPWGSDSNQWPENLGMMKTLAHVEIHGAEVESPMLVGILKPFILIPLKIRKEGLQHMQAVVLHESAHLKRKDNIKLLIIALLRSLFWFNPVVHLVGREWRKDLEKACDEYVISGKSENFVLQYANTLLHISRLMSNRISHPLFSNISHSGSLKRRIMNLYINLPHSKKSNILYKGILVLCRLFLLSGSYLSENARNNLNYSLISHSNGNEEYRLAYWKDGLENIMVNNLSAAHDSVPGASLLKVPMAIALLSEESFTLQDSSIPWDGSPQPFPPWEADHDLESAMKYSVTWYFKRAMDGNVNFPSFTNQIGYQGFSGRNVQEYMNSFYISPLNQTHFMRQLYHLELECSTEAQINVKAMLYQGQFGHYAVYGKTGTSMDSRGQLSGWFSGFAEANGQVIVFSLFYPEKNGLQAKGMILSLLEEDYFM